MRRVALTGAQAVAALAALAVVGMLLLQKCPPAADRPSAADVEAVRTDATSADAAGGGVDGGTGLGTGAVAVVSPTGTPPSPIGSGPSASLAEIVWPRPRWEPWAAFDEAAGSSAETLRASICSSDGSTCDDTNIVARNVKFSAGRVVAWFASGIASNADAGMEESSTEVRGARDRAALARARFDGIEVSVVSRREWEALPCDTELPGPVFTVAPPHKALGNMYHTMNDVVVPLFRMMHEMGYGDPPDSAAAHGRPPSTLWVGPDTAAALPLVWEVLHTLAASVQPLKEALSATHNGTVCAPLWRAGRPFRLNTKSFQGAVSYSAIGAGAGLLRVLRSGLDLYRRFRAEEERWPPRVGLLQRTTSRVLVDPQFFRLAFAEMDIPMDTFVFGKRTSVDTMLDVMAGVDVFIAVQGAGCSNLWFLPPRSVWVEVLPYYASPEQASWYRRQAIMADVAHVLLREPRDCEVDGGTHGKGPVSVQMTPRVCFDGEVNSVYPALIDALVLYVQRHPALADRIKLPAVDEVGREPLLRNAGALTYSSQDTRVWETCYTPYWRPDLCGEEEKFVPPGVPGVPRVGPG